MFLKLGSFMEAHCPKPGSFVIPLRLKTNAGSVTFFNIEVQWQVLMMFEAPHAVTPSRADFTRLWLSETGDRGSRLKPLTYDPPGLKLAAVGTVAIIIASIRSRGTFSMLITMRCSRKRD